MADKAVDNSEVLTAKAHTVLEAGYYHIRHEDISPASIPSSPAKTDTAYLLQLKLGKSAPDLPDGVVSFPSEEREAKGIYILVPSGSSKPNVDPDNIAAAQKLTIESPEADDLAYGLTHQGSKISKVAMLVDDFGLPPAVSNHLDKLMPAYYKGILEACAELTDKEPLLVSERKARNQGNKRVKSALDKISNAPVDSSTPTTSASEKMYAERGFVLGDRAEYGQQDLTCGNGALVFCSPYLLDTDARHRDESGFGVIQRSQAGLTRSTEDGGAFFPACAVLHMGMIKQLKEAGYSNIISVSDTENDGHIHNKCFEGAVLASHFLDEPPQGKGKPINFENTVITRDFMFNGEVITRVNSQDVRRGHVRQESLTPEQFAESLEATQGTELPEKKPPFAEFAASLQGKGVTVLQDGVRMEITSLNTPSVLCSVPAPEITGQSGGAGTPGTAGISLPFATGLINLSEERGGGAARG